MGIRAYSRFVSRGAVFLALVGCGRFIDTAADDTVVDGGVGEGGARPPADDASAVDGTTTFSDVRPVDDVTEASVPVDADAGTSLSHAPDADAGTDTPVTPIDPCYTKCPTKHCTDGGTTCDPLVFITNGLHTGDFGGVDNADAFCMAEKGALQGVFHAWLAKNSTNASDRITPSRGPYRLANGDYVAESLAALESGQKGVTTPINVFANGVKAQAGLHPWTGLTNYVAQDKTCFDWTGGLNGGTTGYTGEADSTQYWSGQSSAAGAPCDELHPLYCFQDDPTGL